MYASSSILGAALPSIYNNVSAANEKAFTLEPRRKKGLTSFSEASFLPPFPSCSLRSHKKGYRKQRKGNIQRSLKVHGYFRFPRLFNYGLNKAKALENTIDGKAWTRKYNNIPESIMLALSVFCTWQKARSRMVRSKHVFAKGLPFSFLSPSSFLFFFDQEGH